MASYLLDTNDLVYRINVADPLHTVTVQAISALKRRRQPLWLTPQVLIEFRRVCTRRVGKRLWIQQAFEANKSMMPASSRPVMPTVSPTSSRSTPVIFYAIEISDLVLPSCILQKFKINK